MKIQNNLISISLFVTADTCMKGRKLLTSHRNDDNNLALTLVLSVFLSFLMNDNTQQHIENEITIKIRRIKGEGRQLMMRKKHFSQFVFFFALLLLLLFLLFLSAVMVFLLTVCRH